MDFDHVLFSAGPDTIFLLGKQAEVISDPIILMITKLSSDLMHINVNDEATVKLVPSSYVHIII